jgi:leucyl-tRNA---protein transferase
MGLYRTGEHPCGYYVDRVARDLVLDPHDPTIADAYPTALAQGFRRSGGHVYRPNCPTCRACVPVRLRVDAFQPDRSQRRCMRNNADVHVQLVAPIRTDAIFALYQRYLVARHADGPMANTDEFDFDEFVASAWSPTRFMLLLEGNQLLGVAITDLLPSALSAVYTFFEPNQQARGLGTLAVLRQIDFAQSSGREHLYLGYWIDTHPKMHYKSRFRPMQKLVKTGWQDM